MPEKFGKFLRFSVNYLATLGKRHGYYKVLTGSCMWPIELQHWWWPCSN